MLNITIKYHINNDNMSSDFDTTLCNNADQNEFTAPNNINAIPLN